MRTGDRLQVTSLVEKPQARHSPSNLAVFGRYVLTPAVLECLQAIYLSAGGKDEMGLTEAIAMSLSKPPGVFAVEYQGEIFDAGTPDAYARALMRYELTSSAEALNPASS
jgi:UTP--glucose-1-phosphate uridylyltransferase